MYNIAVLRVRKGVPGIGQKIARELGAYEVTCNNRPAEKLADDCIVINYGRSEWPVWWEPSYRMINDPDCVANVVNKVRTLDILGDVGEGRVPTLFWTTSKDVAYKWFNYYRHPRIFCRTTVVGKQGNGIVIASTPEEVVDAPLYTLEFPKVTEFRVHVAFGKVIDYVQKKKMGARNLAEHGLEQVNQDIRNHKRGWVFAHNDIDIDNNVMKIAVDATQALGLDYCGVDILKDAKGNSLVCELNSAPGMSSPTTFNRYISAFIEVINNFNRK